MKLIVAVDNNWAIGCAGSMLFRLPQDLKHFQSTTLNHVVVMGRKTLLSLPGGKPLKDRTNIVLTSDKNFEIENVITVNSVEEALDLIIDLESSGKEVFIIGGETIYTQFEPYCSEAIVTHIDAEADKADSFFPDLSKLSSWEKVSQASQIEDNGLKTSYVYYKNINVASF